MSYKLVYYVEVIMYVELQ